ncbi:MAG: hypothetical protein H8E42_11925 [Nitrospinae bacterium]|nr:hypothetical protein [Nitrospinota bacterium]MBL7020078.1 hypothetical protein [Nitrospinaceae bacterium]
MKTEQHIRSKNTKRGPKDKHETIYDRAPHKKRCQCLDIHDDDPSCQRS